MDFLDSFESRCILVGHNAKNFDCKIIVNHLSQHKLFSRFKELCKGFSDSKLIFTHQYPDRKVNKLSYKQVDLCKDIGNFCYEAHNSLEDVKALQKLCSVITSENIFSSSFSVDYVKSSLDYCT